MSGKSTFGFRGAPILALVLALPGSAAAAPDAGELRAFREAADRYTSRMREFHADVSHIVDVTEQEERERIESTFGAAVARNQEDGSTLRRVTIAKIEGFLQRYPETAYAADMKFRLADLYYDEAEVEFMVAGETYDAIEDPAPELEPRKDYRRSIALYNDVLANYPSFEFRPDAYYMLGWCHGSANALQYDEVAARDAYVAIVTQHPKSVFANDANMRLGEHFFELRADRADPLANVRTAITYYNAVLADGVNGRNYDRAIYKLGWSYYKLDDYDRALGYLVVLLDYSDTRYELTGQVADTRKEAVEYLAISYGDMADKQGKKPIGVASAHLAKLGDKKWQHDVVERLAKILEQQTKYDEAIDVYRYLQTQWPLDPKNPIYQHEIALIYGARMPVRNPEAAAVALTELGQNYTEGTNWHAANRNNPDAIAAARGFIESSLATIATEKLLRARETRSPGDYRDAAETFRSFLQKYPFAADYDLYEWYLALCYYEGKEFTSAVRQYQQVLKNPRSKYKDGARFQLMKSLEAIALAKFGKLEAVPQGALVANTVTTPAGKQVVQYMISDEQKAFVVASDDLAEREFTDPDWVPVLEKIRPAMAYLGGVVSYNHGYYDEARKRFRRQIALYPGAPETAYAIDLLIQTYTNEGDLAKVEETAREFSREEIAQQANLQRCLDFSNAGSHGESAACYAEFRKQWPTSTYQSVALYSEANQLDMHGQTGPANILFEKYINDYPLDERSKSLYFRIASGYSSILELDKSVRYFDKLVSVAPDHPDAAAARYNAAFLRTGMGLHKEAAQNYEEYANLPNVPDAERIYWMAGEQWELVGPREATAFYERYLRQPFAAQNPSHAIIAMSKLSDLYAAKGEKVKARAKAADMDRTFRENVASGVSSDARKLVAREPVRLLVVKLDEFRAYKWSSSEKANADLLLKSKPEALRQLVDECLSLIQTYQDYDAAAAALYVQGAAYFAYADLVYSFPVPAGFSDEEKEIFQAELDERFSPIRLKAEDTGKARLQGSLEKARVDKRWSEWNGKALELLHDRFPLEYAGERKESRGAGSGLSVEFQGAASPAQPGGEK
jgi:cellulose synthase operon protein C